MFQSLIYEEKINELAPKVYIADIQKGVIKMIISMNNKEIIQHIIIAIIMTLMMIFLEDDNILIDIFNHAIALARTKIECDKLKNKRVD